MGFDCFSWIFGAWNEFFNTNHNNNNNERAIIPLPDEIVLEIISRLPADDVMKFRTVFTQFKSLIHTPQFSQFHLRRASSGVLLQYKKMGLFFFDKQAREKHRIITRTGYIFTCKRQDRQPLVFSSCNGLILFKMNDPCPLFFYIYNPITEEEIILDNPMGSGGFTCAIYFHSSGEYRLINVHKNGQGWYYFAGGFSNKQWRKLKNLRYPPEGEKPPVVLNGICYWMVQKEYAMNCSEFIISFNTETETFGLMPHPGDNCGNEDYQRRYKHSNMKILEKEGKLCFCQIDYFLKRICIWIQEHPRDWIYEYKIQIDWIFRFSCFESYGIEVVNIEDDAILLYSFYRGFFRYSLQSNILSKIDVEIDGVKASEIKYSDLLFINYTKSLESWE